METKEKYLEQAEIKVKNVLSDLYEAESDTLKEIGKTKEKLDHKLTELKSHYSEVIKQRELLQDKYMHMKEAKDKQWDKSREEFELILEYIEGDKGSFIQKAENVIAELGVKIMEIEKKASDAASETKATLTKKIDELKSTKADLQEKIDKIKTDSSDKWKEAKHWFFEKSRIVREYISTIGQD